ncbi:MAG: hypothetical protein ACJZ70_04285 [Limisphaerales bacterium]
MFIGLGNRSIWSNKVGAAGWSEKRPRLCSASRQGWVALPAPVKDRVSLD